MNYRIPESKQLYDSSCGKTKEDPILWVTFNDAQSYPEVSSRGGANAHQRDWRCLLSHPRLFPHRRTTTSTPTSTSDAASAHHSTHPTIHPLTPPTAP